MKLMRIGPPGAERPVALLPDGRHLDLYGLTDDIDGTFLAGGGLDRVRAAIAEDELPTIDVRGLRVGSPVARPGVVLCVGMNYAAHAAESGATAPRWPVVFYKSPRCVVGPYDKVLLPRGSSKTDWEVELAVVIGTRARYLTSPDDALAHVAGYTISNDVSERALQLETSGGQWSKGKSCETFNPLGPWLVTPEEISSPQDLGLRSWVDGDVRQASSTRDMIFDVSTLIHALSQFTVLEPGDVINTGTPEGVALSGRFPYLKEGNIMEFEIDGLGRQRQRVGQA
ncbi:fumarylacetoacetate hydrolase family protein [Streptomyces sp. NPDC056190]|uniref:fumarylacetoacetate hydrolase family protein n=1 Tax=Streptomyces sp. NPDC056190 TaxID=3345741 RepID=UPI0035DCCAA1